MRGLQWLAILGEALVQLDIAWSSRVTVDRWEFDECVSLHLQKPVKTEVPRPIVAMGPVVTKAVQEASIRGGEWWTFRIPIGAVNSHDVRWTLRAILGERKSELVMQSSLGLQAINGL